MDFTYKRVGSKDFIATVEAVEHAVRSHGFVLSRTHDIRATLAAKGFDIQPLRIFEVVRSGANQTGTAEQDLVNVCRLHVYLEGETVHVTAIRPTAISQVFPDHSAQEAAAALEESVVRLVDDVVEA